MTTAQARADSREWVQQRRARTRLLIELGGLVQKANIVALTDDDRATIYGALLDLADQMSHGREAQTDHRTAYQMKTAWRRKGLNAFEAERSGDDLV